MLSGSSPTVRKLHEITPPLIVKFFCTLHDMLEKKLRGHSRAQAFILGVCTILTIQQAYKLYQRNRHTTTKDIKKYLINSAYGLLTSKIPLLDRPIPVTGRYVQSVKDKELKKIVAPIRDKAFAQIKELGFTDPTMPQKGKDEKQILAAFDKLQAHYEKGKHSGTNYADHDEKLLNLVAAVYKKTAFTNPMHSTWPIINAMEAQFITWCHHLFHSEIKLSDQDIPRRPPGFITDGGTRSNFEACRAYIRYAKTKKGIQKPEILAPSSAHVSFKNAAEALGAEWVEVPVNQATGKADPEAMERAITGNTCMMVGSAISFPRGVFDPIEELAEIAKEHGIPLHVDACLGAFLNVHAQKAGFEIPKFDFSVPGVMSASADMHKYGETPKGSSVILFHPQNPATSVFADFTWEGGFYAANGMIGSRRGDAIATTWTIFSYIGQEKYVAKTREILTLAKEISELIATTFKGQGIKLMNDTELSVIAIDTTDKLDSRVVADELAQKHWEVSIIQPRGFHFCITSQHVAAQRERDLKKEFIDDLSSALEYARKNPTAKPKGIAKAYGVISSSIPLPDDALQEMAEIYVAINTSLPTMFSAAPLQRALTEPGHQDKVGAEVKHMANVTRSA